MSKSQAKLIIHRTKRKAINKFERANNIKREKWIVREAKDQDRRKRKLENDLSKEFVLNMIKDGCSYCESGRQLLKESQLNFAINSTSAQAAMNTFE